MESSAELLGATRGAQPVGVEVKAEYLSGHGADRPNKRGGGAPWDFPPPAKVSRPSEI